MTAPIHLVNTRQFVYAGVLGPTAILIYRRLCRELAKNAVVVDIAVGELGRGVGVKPAVASRAIKRLIDFDVASWEDGIVALRTELPPLSFHTVERLSDEARRVHTVAPIPMLVRR